MLGMIRSTTLEGVIPDFMTARTSNNLNGGTLANLESDS